MPNSFLPDAQPSFEALKRLIDHGAEYWSARELQPLLGYGQCRRFEDAIERAKTSCEQSGSKAGHHFAGAGKPIKLHPVTPVLTRGPPSSATAIRSS